MKILFKDSFVHDIATFIICYAVTTHSHTDTVRTQ